MPTFLLGSSSRESGTLLDRKEEGTRSTHTYIYISQSVGETRVPAAARGKLREKGSEMVAE